MGPRGPAQCWAPQHQAGAKGRSPALGLPKKKSTIKQKHNKEELICLVLWICIFPEEQGLSP